MDRNIDIEADEAVDAPAVDYVGLTSDVVAAYLSNNPVRPADIPGLIAGVHTALSDLDKPAAAAELEVAKLTPAQIRKSIMPDAIISFIDGKGYKTLKRHLTKHGLDPHSYRERYGLPADYPVTAAAYSAARSALAKGAGFGRRRAGPDTTGDPSEEDPADGTA